MAKKPMVTRTFTITQVNMLVLDVETHLTHEECFNLVGKIKKEQEAIDRVNEMVDPGNKAVAVLEVDEGHALYGMTEDDFFKYSQKLPDRKTGSKGGDK